MKYIKARAPYPRTQKVEDCKALPFRGTRTHCSPENPTPRRSEATQPDVQHSGTFPHNPTPTTFPPRVFFHITLPDDQTSERINLPFYLGLISSKSPTYCLGVFGGTQILPSDFEGE